jgi:hypothetical protein
MGWAGGEGRKREDGLGREREGPREERGFIKIKDKRGFNKIIWEGKTK